MKTTRHTYKSLLLIIAFITGCQDSFLERTPYDALPVEKFYKTDAQIRSASAYLYAQTWFDYTDKATSGMELLAGNGMTDDVVVNRFGNFSLTGDYTQVIYPWRAFYNTIGRANVLISDLKEVKPGASVTQQVINSATAEARFIRAMAYFYLVQLWGDVPIIADNKTQITDPFVSKAPVGDVYRFIIEDLKFVEGNAPLEDEGRVTTYAAKALLAKVHLTRATLLKSADDFNAAANYAKEVIDNSHYGLMSSYADLWMTKNDNNIESIFALQCAACATGGDNWGNQNSLQAYFAFDGTIGGVGDGWNMLRPSIDLINAYEAGDLRKKPTIMEDGNKYDEIHSKTGGLTYTKRKTDNSLRSPTGASIKKFVVGSPDDEAVCFMSTGLNVPLLRFADVLLTFAEAKLALGASTSDAEALTAFNRVRTRAGLATKTSLTYVDILKERRTEFAIEFQFWFDLLRYHNIDATGAIAFISAQNRGGTISGSASNEVVSVVNYIPEESDFLFPIPANDASANPKLLEPPVPYYKD
jgi:starch-binding outer membrane protein, SusD/RagB family